MAYEAEICKHCGTRDADWRDPETKYLKDVPPYDVVTVQCAGCVEIENERSRDDVKRKSVGLYYRLEPHDPLRHIAMDED
jgi:hypothetical protein